jgi:hypothetical protein
VYPANNTAITLSNAVSATRTAVNKSTSPKTTSTPDMAQMYQRTHRGILWSPPQPLASRGYLFVRPECRLPLVGERHDVPEPIDEVLQL